MIGELRPSSTIIIKGLQVTSEEVEEKARDIVGILQMWELSRTDAANIAAAMLRQIKAAPSWVSPLAGTGMIVPGHPGWKGNA